MIICVCRGVTERQVRQAARSGSTCLDRLGSELGVATQCGRCRDCALRILRDEAGRSVNPAAAGGSRAPSSEAAA